MTDDAPQDLRTRRRLDTQHEIHQAALQLFEEQGVRETTVPQIADRAGVSPRTFFRYFSTKEQAALPGQRRLLDAIETLEISGDDVAAAMRAVEAAMEAVIGREHEAGLAEHRRVAALLARESDLRALAASQERTLTARLRARLAELLTDHDPVTVLLVAEVAVAVWRASWDRWGELTVAGEVNDPTEVYRRCREALREVVA
ncbi:TetR family transcriptional regulator [Georgenia subflava]|uniref:TetR family transcriptional regulator n=1 Tax=Georgenia subflava TaxID=1622177 RepID=UPI001D02EDC3|nr:TetR family transcriptional regulator [Georgenia subflava]